MGFNGKQIVHDYCIIAATAVYMHEYNLFNWHLLHANTCQLDLYIDIWIYMYMPQPFKHCFNWTLFAFQDDTN
jgi:hypothetical protein